MRNSYVESTQSTVYHTWSLSSKPTCVVYARTGNKVNWSETLGLLVSPTVINHCVAERAVRMVNSHYLCSMDRACARSITPCNLLSHVIYVLTAKLTYILQVQLCNLFW